jgi:hypothetical protein
MMIPISLGDMEAILTGADADADVYTGPCTDATQWVVMKSTENGKCFNVCMADPTMLFEVDCPSTAIETGGIKRTTSPPQSPLVGQTIIKGVPNWVVIGGAAVLGVMLANR